MATAHFAQRGPMPNAFKSDLDMDALFDFNQGTISDGRSNTYAGPSTQAAPVLKEETESFAGPSHEYDRFPQQTGVGISMGDMQGLASLNRPLNGNFDTFGGFNSGLDDNNLGWDMDSDTNMDVNNMGFGSGMRNGSYVDPSFVDVPEEPQPAVRLWPGMHQQAALAKQQQQQQRHQQAAPQDPKGKGKAVAHSDRHTEESISRLLNQMRQNSSSLMDDDTASQNGMSSGFSRMRKDEEDMDEDERLLASEEGKKLSSKERRQLRNKVSARAFRSRRKEYIGQLEGEVAAKAQEVSSLQADKNALSEENARYRALIETLLRHPSFTPFIEDISKDPNFINAQVPRRSTAPSSASQQPSRTAELPSVPEESAMLNSTNNFNSAPQQMSFDFSQPQFYSQQTEATLDLNPSRQGSFF